MKIQEAGFPGILSETLDTSMLGNMLTGKGFVKAVSESNNMDNMDRNF